jgi:ParB/RepB/Spo0J family partition protein
VAHNPPPYFFFSRAKKEQASSMSQEILVSQIHHNPYQSRKRIDQAAVTRMAKEIDAQGFWDQSFRVRAVNGNYQLVFGHTRLEALRSLGHKRVNVEVVDLDDIAMAQQSLIENIQRDNLPEIDKAEAIARLLNMMLGPRADDRNARSEAIGHLCVLLGYKSRQTILNFLSMAGMSEPTKVIARRENMPRSAALVARDIGGEKMVRFAATKRINRDALDAIRKSLAGLSKESRQKVVDRIIERQITDPDAVKKMARREAEKAVDIETVPPDVMMFIEKWSGDLRVWTKKIKAATKVKAYIHQHPEILGEFRNAAEEFIAALKELLDL